MLVDPIPNPPNYHHKNCKANSKKKIIENLEWEGCISRFIAIVIKPNVASWHVCTKSVAALITNSGQTISLWFSLQKLTDVNEFDFISKEFCVWTLSQEILGQATSQDRSIFETFKNLNNYGKSVILVLTWVIFRHQINPPAQNDACQGL